MTVEAFDGTNSATRAVAVAVTGVNGAPVFDGPDGGDFTIAGGVLGFVASPDFEAPTDRGADNVYEVTVEASDGEFTVTRAVTVTVANTDEAATLSLSSQQPQASTVLTVTLVDPDGGVTGRLWSWQRSTDRTSWSPIGGAATRRYTPNYDDLGHYLRVSVSYSDGHGDKKRAQQTSQLRTQAAPVLNSAPSFPAAGADRSVAENSPPGTPVGLPVTASDLDPDDNDRLTYTLTGGRTDLFNIDGATGQIRVGPDAELDHETTDSYSVTVEAADPSNASDTLFVDIAVTDVNEAPTAADDEASTFEDQHVVINVLANDGDPENTDLAGSLRRLPDHGTTTVNADDTIIYTPPRRLPR